MSTIECLSVFLGRLGRRLWLRALYKVPRIGANRQGIGSQMNGWMMGPSGRKSGWNQKA